MPSRDRASAFVLGDGRRRRREKRTGKMVKMAPHQPRFWSSWWSAWFLLVLTQPSAFVLADEEAVSFGGVSPAPTRRHPIYIGGFLPYDVPNLDRYESIKAASDIALRQINNSPHILKDYHLNIIWNDSKCNPGVSMKEFFDLVDTKPTKTFIFGATCSPVTDIIAKAAKHWSLIQLSYADTHPMFNDQGYPHFFRIIPSENEYNAPRLSVLKYFNWTIVGTIYQNEAHYALANNDLVSKLARNNFTVSASQSFNDELTDQLETIRSKDIRIILGNFNHTWARHVFCDAYRRNMYGSKYQWLIAGVYPERWWALPGGPCSVRHLETALQGTIVMETTPLSTNKDDTALNITSAEFERLFSQRTDDAHASYHGYAFDGIYALAKALDDVSKFADLRDFEYNNNTWQQWLIEKLHETSFNGVTGPVRFKRNSRRGNIVIKQLQFDAADSDDGDGDDGENTLRSLCIGEYSGVTRTLQLEKCRDIFWHSPLGKPPRDHTVTRIVPARLNLTIFAAFCVISAVGILLALTFLGINVRFRHERHIKMSSPNMNNLIIIGCILTYVSVVLLGLDSSLSSPEAFPYVCTARAWVLMSGFTLSFGSMFSKTWRVHSIFTNVQLNKKVMKDYQLYLVVGALVLIDVIIMTTWQFLDPFERRKKLLPAVTGENEVQILPEIEYCHSGYMNVFVGCIYAYKGGLMLFGAFLAWETRAVQIPALNDSKYVGISVYNVTIMCVLGVAVSFVLSDEQTASFLLIATFIIFCNTGTLSLVFVPKIIDLKRDPATGASMRGGHNGGGRSGHGAAKGTMKVTGMKFNNKPVQSTSDMLQIAKRVNAKLRNAIVEIDKELALAMALESKTATAAPAANNGNGNGNNGNVNSVSASANNVVSVVEREQELKEKGQSTSTVTSDYFSSNSKSQSTTIRRELGVCENHQHRNGGFHGSHDEDDDEEEEVMPGKAAFQSYSHEQLTETMTSTTALLSSSSRDAYNEELASQEMLPIFQRLLMDRTSKKNSCSSRRKRASNTATSCPNISVKCDIVEYL